MKARLAACLAVLTAPLFAVAPGRGQDCSELYQQAVRSVVVVYNPSNNRRGAGVVVAPSRVLTVKHILEGANEVIVSSYDRASHTATVARRRRGQDLAMVMVHTPLHAPPIRIDRAVPEPGEMLCVIGHPPFSAWVVAPAWVMTKELTISARGKVSRLVYVFSPLLPGCSGGPAVTRDGSLAGLISTNWGELVEVKVGNQRGQARVPAAVGGFVPIRHACGKLIDCDSADP